MKFKTLNTVFICCVLLLSSALVQAEVSTDMVGFPGLSAPDTGEQFGEMSAPPQPRDDYCIPGVTRRACPRDGGGRNPNNSHDRNCEVLLDSCLDGCNRQLGSWATKAEIRQRKTECQLVCNLNYRACLKGEL